MTLVSMTGYGSSRVSKEGLELTVEIKSVNSRHLDLSFRLPQIYSNLEQSLAKVIKDKILRGRIDIFVSRKAANDDSFEVRFSEKLYKDFFDLFLKKSKELKLKEDQLSIELFKLALSRREILEITSSSPELNQEEGSLVDQALIDAVVQLVQMRKAEGQVIEQVVTSYIDQLEKELVKIKDLSAKFNGLALEKIATKLDKYKKEIAIDPDRIAQELAILLDRADISEEISRIESHFVQFRKIISRSEGGKKIEFLLQELGREFNTVGSKTQMSEISQCVIEAKSILEKIREQAANVE